MSHAVSPVRHIIASRRAIAAITTGLLLLGGLASPALAQDVCFDRADHDGDGMGSYAECNFGTNPLDPDSDHDGLIDPEEVYRTGTNPHSPDSDGDGLGDWFELNTGSDPLVNGNVAPAAPVDPAPQGRPDRDGDGLYDDDETNVYGTNPDVSDTDGDGSSDGDEVYYDTDPLG